MYGHNKSLFSDPEVYSQLALACIWAVSLLVLLILSLTTRSTTTSPNNTAAAKATRITLRLSLFLFFTAHVLLAVRLGLIVSGSYVYVVYRYESSVVVLAVRLGLAALFVVAGGLLGLQKNRVLSALLKGVYWMAALAYGTLSVAYVALDFIVSADALERYLKRGFWLLGDRDFSLLMNKEMIMNIKTGLPGSAIDFRFLFRSMWDTYEVTTYQNSRDAQIRIGVALGALGVVMAVLLMCAAVWLFLAEKRGPVDNVLVARRSAVGCFLLLSP